MRSRHSQARINDTDGHEAMPIKRWGDIFGDEVKPLADALLNAANEGVAIIQNPDLVADDTEINAHNVWKVKMEKAPGSFDISRRIEGDELHGRAPPDHVSWHRRHLCARRSTIRADDPKVFRSITGDRKAYAYRLMDIYNDWWRAGLARAGSRPPPPRC